MKIDFEYTDEEIKSLTDEDLHQLYHWINTPRFLASKNYSFPKTYYNKLEAEMTLRRIRVINGYPIREEKWLAIHNKELSEEQIKYSLDNNLTKTEALVYFKKNFPID